MKNEKNVLIIVILKNSFLLYYTDMSVSDWEEIKPKFLTTGSFRRAALKKA